MTDVQGKLLIEIFLNGNLHSTRRWHVCPRVGEHIGLHIDGEDVVCRVYRVFHHLRADKVAEHIGWQEIDLYVLPEDAAALAKRPVE